VIANLDGNLILIAIKANRIVQYNNRKAGSLNTYAVDYNKQIYSVAVNASTI
jgi:hypothetical protein